jgi:predicted nuclease with TOPRIM domain
MKLHRFIFITLFLGLSATLCFAQAKTKPVAPTGAQSVKTSPAYAEVLLRKTELLAELESLLIEYTEEYPKVKESRFEAGLLQKELDRLLAANVADASRLSAALGKLMVRKCELGVDLWSLQEKFNDQHPDVKRAKRKAEIFEAAINDILQGK